MPETTENRRAYHRIFFQAPVAVMHNDHSHKALLVDISLNGALLSSDSGWQPEPGQQVSIKVALSGDSDNIISMDASVAHVKGEHVGLRREHIDMDSISHLRRLVELNLGDSDLLHRELEHLVTPDDAAS